MIEHLWLRVQEESEILTIDMDGAMMEAFAVGGEGHLTVSKAQSTAHDEAGVFMESMRDTLAYWGTIPEEALPTLIRGFYSGPSMLMSLFERKGRRAELLVTEGAEDSPRMNRAAQMHLNYFYLFVDRLCGTTVARHEPHVLPEDIRGTRERIRVYGQVSIRLYKREARTNIEQLLVDGIEALVNDFVLSWSVSPHAPPITWPVSPTESGRQG